MTIYSHFQDKEALFESIVRTVSDAMIAALSDPDPGGDDPAERLVAVGRAFLGVILGPQIAVLCHTLPGALRTNRDLGPRFYDAGPGRAHAVLAGIIAAELTVDDPQQAAADLLSLWQGDIGARIAFGVAETLSPADIDRRARRGTALFLKIHKKEAVVF
jgi:TetR/AcrR family transcriptional repressor of mexJK operon